MNLLSFKVGWALCAFAAAVKNDLVSLGTVFAIVSFNLLLVSTNRQKDIIKISKTILLGYTFELINMHTGLYQHAGTITYPPIWVLCFWPTFGVLFFDFMDLFKDKSIWVLFGVGAFSGAGYIAAESMAQLEFTRPVWFSLTAFSALWASEFCLLVWIMKKVDQNFAADDRKM